MSNPDKDEQTLFSKNYTNKCNLETKDAFAKFIRKHRKKYNEDAGKELKTKDLAKCVGIGYESFRKILNKERPTEKRDCVIAIGIAVHLFQSEMDEALQLYDMPALDEKDPRDNMIIEQIWEHVVDGIPELTIDQLNLELEKAELGGLDINITSNKAFKELPYEIIDIHVSTTGNINYLFNDPYDSLSTKYDPSLFCYFGDMILYDNKLKEKIYLQIDASGEMFSATENKHFQFTKYDCLDKTGGYKEYFIYLQNFVKVEKKRIYGIYKDTKNYKCRSSARVIDDSLCVFTEEFNYIVPEVEEYYVLFRMKGKYILRVYDESAFMQYYFPKDKYYKFYHRLPVKAKETYTSIEQIVNLLEITEKHTYESIKLKMRKKAFERLIPIVNELYEKIKIEDVYIQNPYQIYGNEYEQEILFRFKLQDDFEYREEETEDLTRLIYMQNRDYLLKNGQVINISQNDLLDAFKLGLETIQDIIRIKSKYGSIRNLIQ